MGNLKEKMKEGLKEDNCSLSAVYGLGFVGAVIYYISMVTSFWLGVLGVLKAIVWPVFLVYKAFIELGT
ncbi:hypothetical protein ACFLTE_12135 [Bacteroidota bacterium]